jgi:antirestriction protein ArdC
MSQQTAQQQPESKSIFTTSNEAHAQYVGNMAYTINKLTRAIKKGDRPAVSVSAPYCPTTGFAYGGSSMTRLMLASIENKYKDDRWLTFKQLQKFKSENRLSGINVKKGQHGVKLLRAEVVFYVVGDDGKVKFLENEYQAKEQQNQGADVQQQTLFYPYVVFNASQIEGFPPKENPTPALSVEERNAAIDNFVACLGVEQKFGSEQPSYQGAEDALKLPDQEKFGSPDEYYAMKLRLAFHATAHPDRERREGDDFENMRGEAFSLLAGAKYGLPMPVDGGSWPDSFGDEGKFKALEASADAARMLSVLDQFSRGEEVKAGWFPKQADWPELIAAQESPSAPAASSGPRPR